MVGRSGGRRCGVRRTERSSIPLPVFLVAEVRLDYPIGIHLTNFYIIRRGRSRGLSCDSTPLHVGRRTIFVRVHGAGPDSDPRDTHSRRNGPVRCRCEGSPPPLNPFCRAGDAGAAAAESPLAQPDRCSL